MNYGRTLLPIFTQRAPTVIPPVVAVLRPIFVAENFPEESERNQTCDHIQKLNLCVKTFCAREVIRSLPRTRFMVESVRLQNVRWYRSASKYKFCNTQNRVLKNQNCTKMAAYIGNIGNVFIVKRISAKPDTRQSNALLTRIVHI